MATSSSSCWSGGLSFKEMTDFMELTSKETKKKTKYRNLTRFLASCRSKFSTPTCNLYPVMRLLMPDLDKARGSYMIKETVMANLYIEFLQLGPNSADALKLKNFRAPKNNPGGEAGDFASILHNVLRARSYTSSALSCADINHTLDEIVRATSGGEGRRAVARIFKQMFLKMDASEQKWFVRLILKDLMLGLGEKALLTALHQDAKDMYDVNANLSKVCEKLVDPEVRMHEMEVTLLSPFKPQLADRVALNRIAGMFQGRQFYIETKYDGERAQIHVDGDQFRYFSRNGNDFSHDFGPTVSESRGLFSGHLAKSLARAGVRSVILDGEMCAWSKQGRCIVQKGEQFNIRVLDPEDPRFQQCLVLYDICLLNGEVVTNKPLRERAALLEKLVEVQEGRVELVSRIKAESGQEVVAALNDAIDRREEGLVVKDPESVYKPGGRAGGGWIKVKPEYQNQLMDQLDLAVVAGYYGKGRAGGQVTHFLLAVRDSGDRIEAKFRHGGDEGGDTFYSLCRVSCGYSASELVDLVAKCITTQGKLSCVMVGREKPDVWYDPSKSPVLQVKAAEIVASETHATRCTLRFPRVEKIREDKDSGSCTSRQELERLREQGGGKLFGAVHLTESQGEEGSSARKRPRVQDRPKLDSRYRHQDLTGERVDSHSLKGKVVVVEPADGKLKAELERLVVKHGGKVEQNVRLGHTSLYVETGMAIKARNLVSQGKVDVVRSSWLLEAGQQVLDPQPHQVVFATAETKARWGGDYDRWLDSYTLPATVESLRYSMSLVGEAGDNKEAVGERRENKEVSVDERAELEEECEMIGEKCFLFRRLVFHFPQLEGKSDLTLMEGEDSGRRLEAGSNLVVEEDSGMKLEAGSYLVLEEDSDLSTSLRLTALQAEFYGGSVVKEMREGVSHVILTGDENTVWLTKLRRERREIGMFYILSQEWVETCLMQGRLVGEEPFLL